jgi:cbb3-type cytochrome oxidase maturation protein
MSALAWLVPIALGMGLAGMAAFLWSMRAGQYEDLDGAAARVLQADAADRPLSRAGRNGHAEPEPPSAGGNPQASGGVRR